MYQMLEGLGSRIEKEGLLERYRHMEQSSIFTEEWCDLTKRFFDALPYSLTKGQLSAASEIICDLKRPVPMNRLLQVWIRTFYCCLGVSVLLLLILFQFAQLFMIIFGGQTSFLDSIRSGISSLL